MLISILGKLDDKPLLLFVKFSNNLHHSRRQLLFFFNLSRLRFAKRNKGIYQLWDSQNNFVLDTFNIESERAWFPLRNITSVYFEKAQNIYCSWTLFSLWNKLVPFFFFFLVNELMQTFNSHNKIQEILLKPCATLAALYRRGNALNVYPTISHYKTCPRLTILLVLNCCEHIKILLSQSIEKLHSCVLKNILFFDYSRNSELRVEKYKNSIHPLCQFRR